MSNDVLAVGPRGDAKPSAASIDQLCINTIRTRAMDAVEKAKSGHPGTPMALAPVAYALWQNVLRYDPEHPAWPNRDRFVLSNGHASMLLYALIHLAGIRDDRGGRSQAAITLDDIKQFRQLGSQCPGHPEYRHAVGVETTTGPLGQGCGNSVGMAIAQRFLAGQFNRPDATLFDYDVYVFCSDGDMMEGISGEAASLAGHLRLSKLCWIFDNNQITIDGNTRIAFTEDVATRFRGYGFAVTHVGDANDLTALGQAFATFRRTNDRPTLIIVDSHIAYGAPHKQDTPAAHGEPLGEAEVRLAKRAYGWPPDAKFLVPDEVYAHFRAGLGNRGRQLHEDWAKAFATYRQRYPDLADRLTQLWNGAPPRGWDADLPVFPADPKGMASREASGKVLGAISPRLPTLVGGSADLVTSTKAKVAGGGDMSATQAGRNIHFGVREHAMAAELSGLALSGLRPFGATFLIFSDYMKPSIRLAAMMQLPVIYVFTHDSIGLGEDGPTHQPIEQLTGLRAIPGLITFRPADANETAEAWRLVVALKDQPACLILTRQALPTLDRTRFAPASGLARGAYVLADADGGIPDVILIGTGSEVSLCVEAQAALAAERIRARVVSMPSWELFARQDATYRENVLPQAVKARISVEAASVLGWERHVGPDGAMIGMHSFGTSAPGKEALKHFGFTAQAVVDAARAQIAKWGRRP
jgi:transketolase